MIVLAVLGAGLSYLGYSESLGTLSVTASQPVTATSTMTVASTSVESTVMTTSGTSWILQDELIDLQAGTTQKYCGWHDARYADLEAGQVHVSYHTESTYHPVDFWMLTGDDWTRWSHLPYCEQVLAFQGTVTKISRSGYEFTTEIGSAGTYYFVFMNENRFPITVTLNVDAGLQTSEVTLTKATTVYSTQVSPYVTEKVTVSTRPRVWFAVLRRHRSDCRCSNRSSHQQNEERCAENGSTIHFTSCCRSGRPCRLASYCNKCRKVLHELRGSPVSTGELLQQVRLQTVAGVL